MILTLEGLTDIVNHHINYEHYWLSETLSNDQKKVSDLQSKLEDLQSALEKASERIAELERIVIGRVD